MKRFVSAAVFAAGLFFGGVSVASACYWQPVDAGCMLVYMQMCSYNADGTGGMYYTGRRMTYILASCM
jgi:hypothetical protein